MNWDYRTYIFCECLHRIVMEYVNIKQVRILQDRIMEYIYLYGFVILISRNCEYILMNRFKFIIFIEMLLQICNYD